MADPHRRHRFPRWDPDSRPPYPKRHDLRTQRWQGTLLVIAVCFVAIIFNTVFAKRLPPVEILILVLHIVGFIAIFNTLWVMALKSSVYNTPPAVFTQFTDGGNWGSIGLSCPIGMLSPVFAFIGKK